MKESRSWNTIEKLIVIMGFLATVFACVVGLLALTSPNTLTRVIVEIAGAPTSEPEVIIVTQQVTVVREPTPTHTLESRPTHTYEPTGTYTPEPTKTPTLILTPSETPTATPSPIPTISNVWDFDIHVNQRIHSDGFIRDANSYYQLVVQLNQDREILTGEYIGTSGNACGNARITGSILGSDVNWTVEYRGSCCRGEKMTFSGMMSTDGSIMTGSLEPVGIPANTCQLWFADLTAIKR